MNKFLLLALFPCYLFAQTPVLIGELTSDADDTVGTTTFTHTHVSGIEYLADDVIFDCQAMDGNNAADNVLTWDAPWTSFIEEGDDVAPTAWGECAWMESDGTELDGTTFSVTSGNSEQGNSHIWVVRGVRDPTANPPTATAVGGNSATPDPPSHTASASDTNFWIGFTAINNGPNPTDATPAGVDNWGEKNADGASSSMCYFTDDITNSVFNPGACAAASNAWVGITIVAEPPSGNSHALCGKLCGPLGGPLR